MRTAVFRKVTLMIFFRAIKGRSRLDLSHNRAAETPALVELFFLRFGGALLFRRMIENDRAILRSDIGPLAISRRGIVIAPENIEQLFVADLVRIELDFDYFRVPGLVTTNLLVGWVFGRSAGVTTGRCGYPFGIAKQFFHTPKTARAKSRFLCAHEAS